MRINIEPQDICVPPESFRGIANYELEIIKALVTRNRNDYSLSFFDYKGERNNREKLESYLSQEVINKVKLQECNEVNYMWILEGCEKNDHSKYSFKSYEDLFEINPDVCYFPHLYKFPHNVRGNVVVNTHDLMPILDGIPDSWNEQTRMIFRNNLKFLEERTEYVITADSESTKKDIINNSSISPDRISVVYAAYDNKFYCKTIDNSVLTKYKIRRPFILYLGAVDKRKGVETFLRASSLIKNQDVDIVVSGYLRDQDKQYFKGIFDGIKNFDDIIFTGYVTDYEKKILMSMAEIFVFPSMYEGFGLPVLEAMACDTPVITTNASSLAEVGGDAVEYINVGNYELLASKIDLLLEDESRRTDMIEKGRAQCSKFSWNKSAEMLEEIFEKAVK